eukprot:scaffold107740_cov25-Prasinocladus_malaysianus.AAC.1
MIANDKRDHSWAVANGRIGIICQGRELLSHLGGVVSKGSQDVRERLDGDLAVNLAWRGGVLALGPYLRVQKVVLDLLEGLGALAASQQLRPLGGGGLRGGGGEVEPGGADPPHVDHPLGVRRQHLAPVVAHRHGGHLARVRDQTHALLRVAVQRHGDESDNLVPGGVGEVVVLRGDRAEHRHPRDGARVGGPQVGRRALLGVGVEHRELVGAVGHHQHGVGCPGRVVGRRGREGHRGRHRQPGLDAEDVG